MCPVQSGSMSNYAYVAVDPQGNEARGTVDGADQSEALRRIREMGLFPTKVSAHKPRPQVNALLSPARSSSRGGEGAGRATARSIQLFGERIKPATLALFT